MEITEVIRHGVITEKSVDCSRPAATTRRRGRSSRAALHLQGRAGSQQTSRFGMAVEQMFGVKVVRVNTMRMPGKAQTRAHAQGHLPQGGAPVEESHRDAGRGPVHPRVAGVSRTGEDTHANSHL